MRFSRLSPFGGERFRNPRSTGLVQEGSYVKHSDENLGNEASELQRCLSMLLRTPHVGAARLIGYDPAQNNLVTERIVGDSLFNVLWNNRSIFNILFDHRGKQQLLVERVEEVGAWLRQYHNSSLLGTDRHIAAKKLDQKFSSKLTALSTKQLVVGILAKRLADYRNVICKTLETAENVDLCQIHGDFVPHNILRDSCGDIHILDFGDTRVGFNLEDVVRFWEMLWSMAQADSLRARLVTAASSAFLRGYGASETIINSKCVMVLRMYNAVNNYLAFHSSRKFLSYRSQYVMRGITNASMRWLRQVVVAQ